MISKSQYEYDALGSTHTTPSALYLNQFAYNPKNEITNAVMGENSFEESCGRPLQFIVIEGLIRIRTPAA